MREEFEEFLTLLRSECERADALLLELRRAQAQFSASEAKKGRSNFALSYTPVRGKWGAGHSQEARRQKWLRDLVSLGAVHDWMC